MEAAGFNWHVHDAGYDWVVGDCPQLKSHLVEVEDGVYEYKLTEDLLDEVVEQSPGHLYLKPAEGDRPREYRPLEEHTGLFRVFAELDGTAAAVLGFADRFGLLYEDWSEDDQELYVPSLDQWRTEVLTMSTCVDLWDAICAEDDDALRGIVTRKGKTMKLSNKVASAVFYYLDNPRIRTTADNLTDAAAELLAHILHMMVRLRGSARWDSKARRFFFHVEPNDLKEALWFQFLVTVCEQKDHVRCEICGEWFERTPQVNRADRVYCSDRCRFKAYRGRQNRARALAKEGKTIKQIARILGSDSKTIEGWLKPRKGEKG